MNDIYYFIISYALIILFGFGLIQFLSNGFLSVFLKAKASRGRKILINVRSKTTHYFVTGLIEGDFLVFDDRESKRNKQKTPKRLAIPSDKNIFYRAFGVTTCNVDEGDNKFILPEGSSVSGFDAIKHSNLYTRALTKPAEIDGDLVKKLLIAIGILCLLGFGFLYFKMETLNTTINAINTVAPAVV